MKKIALVFSLLLSTLSFAGPLEDAYKAQIKKEEEESKIKLPSPIVFNTKTLGKLTADIYNCEKEGEIPCAKVKGSASYQIGIVRTYIDRLEESNERGSFEYNLAMQLFLDLNKDASKVKLLSIPNSDLLINPIDFDFDIKSFCEEVPGKFGCP